MPQFLTTYYKGLKVTRREIVTAAYIAKAREAVMQQYPGATPYTTSRQQPQHVEFYPKFATAEAQFPHLGVSITISREDTSDFEANAHKAE